MLASAKGATLQGQARRLGALPPRLVPTAWARLVALGPPPRLNQPIATLLHRCCLVGRGRVHQDISCRVARAVYDNPRSIWSMLVCQKANSTSSLHPRPIFLATQATPIQREKIHICKSAFQKSLLCTLTQSERGKHIKPERQHLSPRDIVK